MIAQLYPSKKNEQLRNHCKTLLYNIEKKVLLCLFPPTPQWRGLVSSSRLNYPYVSSTSDCNTFLITSPISPLRACMKPLTSVLRQHASGVYSVCVFSLGSPLCVVSPAVWSQSMVAALRGLRRHTPFVFLTVALSCNVPPASSYHKMHFKHITF